MGSRSASLATTRRQKRQATTGATNHINALTRREAALNPEKAALAGCHADLMAKITKKQKIAEEEGRIAAEKGDPSIQEQALIGKQKQLARVDDAFETGAARREQAPPTEAATPTKEASAPELEGVRAEHGKQLAESLSTEV